MSSLKKAGFHNGLSDLIVVNNGKVYFVEIKAPVEYKTSEKTGKQIIAKSAGKQSDEQIKFQQEIENEGLPYVLIDSWKKFEEFLNYLKRDLCFKNCDLKTFIALQKSFSEVKK
jgi:hypothetical protein